MIAVIADDFTGAAELAGIALQYNLSVRLFTHDIVAADVDVIIVSTDSRSLPEKDAIEVTKKAVNTLLKLQPKFIYKKVDSVLRGYVVAELLVQLNASNLKKSLLLPANPSLGRNIINQKYYINQIEISETNFAHDPEFAIKDSKILSMLNDSQHVKVLNRDEDLPQEGIVVGEVADISDITKWMDKVDDQFLLAGAGDFFDLLLQKSHTKQQQDTDINFLSPYLYVSGTSFNNSVSNILDIQQKFAVVHFLSVPLMQGKADELWFKAVSESIKKNQRAIIAINDDLKQLAKVSALALRKIMGKIVLEIIEQEKISEIFIEGGSTAAEILQQLKIDDFIPVNQLTRGVIRLKETNKELYITVKPGSYQLPKQISKLYLSSLL